VETAEEWRNMNLSTIYNNKCEFCGHDFLSPISCVCTC